MKWKNTVKTRQISRTIKELIINFHEKGAPWNITSYCQLFGNSLTFLFDRPSCVYKLLYKYIRLNIPFIGRLEQAAAGIDLHVNVHKTEYMYFNQTGDISTLDGTSLKMVDKFIYLGSSVSWTEKKKNIDTRLTKAWTAIDKLSIIWKSDLTDKMKCSFFQAAVVSILLCGCITWTLTKRLEKKLDGNYTRMLQVIMNKSWRQHPTKHELYGHLPPIKKNYPS